MTLLPLPVSPIRPPPSPTMYLHGTTNAFLPYNITEVKDPGKLSVGAILEKMTLLPLPVSPIRPPPSPTVYLHGTTNAFLPYNIAEVTRAEKEQEEKARRAQKDAERERKRIEDKKREKTCAEKEVNSKCAEGAEQKRKMAELGKLERDRNQDQMMAKDQEKKRPASDAFPNWSALVENKRKKTNDNSQQQQLVNSTYLEYKRMAEEKNKLRAKKELEEKAMSAKKDAELERKCMAEGEEEKELTQEEAKALMEKLEHDRKQDQMMADRISIDDRILMKKEQEMKRRALKCSVQWVEINHQLHSSLNKRLFDEW